ncbi:putative protein kinase [Leishmania braziliensis MHOM/BR/75/M2904]|uniref:non-specific serine/threonine protein kinase n=2 Tax=Leishmania braziliensis TaxID=5660 RepID=A4H848_LEIBR|nr:putative protein kinase [Leishmania braziliensis MHOM/BR/75/M2904]CAJ2469387.1 unnamed protein product [Leishmania braziliensis]CAM42096.1 putative protein kinase [Leishmania braziliensis MHOM/BR/75/M2904]SYZ64213.1 protein_kinase [Leishmania braziliensis MHOM/BR/75/M2904]
MNFLGASIRKGGIHRKDRGFSSKNKVQQYHDDGTESIIVMGRPFRVLQKISDLPPPYMVGRQRSSKYGAGGSSYVYLVENSSHLPEFPRHMALKRSFFGVDQVAEAHKEVDIVSRISDKNIARVFHSEISRNEGRLGVSIAMEYCSNNLYRRIRSSTGTGAGTRLTEGEICHVLCAVTSAVGYLHTQQPPIAHRDIRPENILINNKRTGPAAYKLTNFSNASTEAYHCETREEANIAIADIQIHTSPAFRSPEMSDPWSKKRICEKSDMWSIGVLLYYMMYLRLPFDPSISFSKENWVIHYPHETIGSYTGSLHVILEHLLDPNPDSRWDVFALTNYIRFDEDCSRHLGTFCFTMTEWPEGWEEQEVRVVGRTAPPKAPRVSYSSPRREQLGNLGDGYGDGFSYIKNDYSTGRYDIPPSSTVRNRVSGGNVDAVQEAMIVLGSDPVDDDPELAEYRKQIVKEQEEAWEQAKAEAGYRASLPANSQNNDAEPALTDNADNETEKKDVFDDLFAAPSPVLDPTPPIPSPSAPLPTPQQPKEDIFSTNDLFSAPVPQAQSSPSVMINPYGQAPQPQQAVAMSGWSSGAPVIPSGGYPMQHQQQQAPWGYGGSNPNVYAPPQQEGFQGGYPMQQQQQQQQSINFMAPSPGQKATNAPPVLDTTKPASPKKDPFADLFN